MVPLNQAALGYGEQRANGEWGKPYCHCYHHDFRLESAYYLEECKTIMASWGGSVSTPQHKEVAVAITLSLSIASRH